MKEKKIITADALIVGGGLAGALMGLIHLMHHKTVIIIDAFNPHSASHVAAGIVNPLQLKNITRAWNSDTLFSFLHDFYPKAESFLGCSIFNQTPVLKFFSSQKEENDWQIAASDSKTKGFISQTYKPHLPADLISDFGFGAIKSSGWIDIKTLIKSVKTHKNTQYLNQAFNYEQLNIKNDNIVYVAKDSMLKTKSVFFCEGIGVLNNPLFKPLKLTPTHGEVLKIKTPISLQNPIHRSGFILPLGNNTYKVGSTYNNTILPNTTAKGKTYLMQTIEKNISCKYEITDHSYGIRPNVYDRRPIIGQHPKHSNCYIFNGLGSRGASQGPYYAQMLYDLITKGKKIDPIVDVGRFF